VAEIINGELFTSPRPALPHARAASMIGFALIGTFGGAPEGSMVPGGWWIPHDPELHLGEDVLVPDLVGWRRERPRAIPDAPTLELPPDWACDIVSPSTGAIDRGRKMRLYAREGSGSSGSSTRAPDARGLPPRRRTLGRGEHARRQRSGPRRAVRRR